MVAGSHLHSPYIGSQDGNGLVVHSKKQFIGGRPLKLVGHASPTTTARYDRRPEDDKRQAVAMLHVPYVAWPDR